MNTTHTPASHQYRPTTNPNNATTQTQWCVQETGLTSNPNPAVTSNASHCAPRPASRRTTGTITASSTSPSTMATGNAQPARPDTRSSNPFND